MTPSEMEGWLEHLQSLMTEPTKFIAEVFGSYDSMCIEQCEDIIRS